MRYSAHRSQPQNSLQTASASLARRILNSTLLRSTSSCTVSFLLKGEYTQGWSSVASAICDVGEKLWELEEVETEEMEEMELLRRDRAGR